MVARVALSVEKYERWGIAALDLIDYFAPAYVSGQTFNGVFGEFELRVEPSGCQFDICLLFSAKPALAVNGITYLQGEFQNGTLSGPTFTADLINPTFSVGLIEEALTAGGSEAVITLDPTVEWVVSLNAVATPEASTLV